MFCKVGEKYLDASGYADTPQQLVDRLGIYGGKITAIKNVAEAELDGDYDQEDYNFAKRLIEVSGDFYRKKGRTV